MVRDDKHHIINIYNIILFDKLFSTMKLCDFFNFADGKSISINVRFFNIYFIVEYFH